jgi:ABC-type glycerol-3-phosphate transport system substrate-binding protein
LKINKKAAAAVGVLAIVGSALISMPSQAATKKIPSLLVWVDSPRLPGAKEYAKIMKGKVNVKVELHAQGDLLAKVQLFNRVKKGWPDVVFGPPNDVAVLRNPIIGNAREISSLLKAKEIKNFGKLNDWCKGADGKYYCVKNDMAQSVLWYDTALFEEFGYKVPTKMSEFFAIGEDLAANHPGYSLGALSDAAAYSSYFWPSQCPLNNELSATRVLINSKSPKCTRVTKALQPLIDKDVFYAGSAFSPEYIKMAQEGKLVAHIGPSWFGEFVLRPASSFNIPSGRLTAAPMPTWDGEKVNYSGEWGGGIYTISPHAKSPRAALDFAIFMVGDKRNVVDVVNPDKSTGAPTFPAYIKGNKLWKAKIDADTYYKASPYKAMAAQAGKVWTGVKPVRYDADGAWGASFAPELAKSKDIQKALDAYATYTSNLAQQLGYEVTTKK